MLLRLWCFDTGKIIQPTLLMQVSHDRDHLPSFNKKLKRKTSEIKF